MKNILVLGNPEWKPSLLGLVANSFSDEHNRPVFLWGRSESGRSTSEGEEDTELSKANVGGVNEYRVPRFVWPEKTDGYYLRLWIGKTVFIASTNDGFKIKKKDISRLKILFGISGEVRDTTSIL
jgi:hypothetical protein